MTKLEKSELLALYKTMLLIRDFEDRIAISYGKGAIPGEMHLSSGQEAIAVGVCSQLIKTDAVASTHRGHAQLIAKGTNLNKMTAELFGRETGFSKGKGGHMHLFDTDVNYACSGIVGAGMPVTVGSALAAKKMNTGNVAVAFFGDGAANQGTFHESLNMAKLWNLPALFVCEDNRFGISVRQHESTCVPDHIRQVEGYEIPAVLIDGNDIIAVYEAAKEALEYIRAGKGPYYIECKTFRLKGHFEGDPELYKTDDEQSKALVDDPIVRFKKVLLSDHGVTESELSIIKEQVTQEITDAFEYAEKSPWPKPEEALEDVYQEGRA